MAVMTDDLENAVLNLMRGSNITAFTGYLALFTATPSDTGGGTEVSGVNYARQSLSGKLAAPIGGVMASNADISFPVAGGSWGTVTHWGIFDALTDGTLKYYGALTASKGIYSGDQLIVFSGNLSITLD